MIRSTGFKLGLVVRMRQVRRMRQSVGIIKVFEKYLYLALNSKISCPLFNQPEKQTPRTTELSTIWTFKRVGPLSGQFKFVTLDATN